MLFLKYLSISSTRSNLLSISKASSTPLQFYIKVNSAGLCHNLVQRDLEHLSLLQNFMLVHYVDDIVLIGPSEQEVATTLDLLVVPMCIKGWKINPIEIQGPSTSVKFLGDQWCGACRDSPSKVKDKVIIPGPSHHQEKAQCLVGLFGFW